MESINSIIKKVPYICSMHDNKLKNFPSCICWKNGITIIVFLLLTLSCGKRNNIYEHQKSIPDFQWSYDYKPAFKVSIKDTQAKYNIYTIIRHNDKYPFNNLWLIFHTISPSGEQKRERIELELAKKSGKWYGAGLGGMWEVLIPIKEKVSFEEKGLYTFKLEQHMRQNPLPAIMNAGIRIERIKKGLNLKK